MTSTRIMLEFPSMESDAIAQFSEFFEGPELTYEIVQRTADEAYATYRSRESFEAHLEDFEELKGASESLRIGSAYHILDQHSLALDWLAKAPDTKLRRYLAAHSMLALGRIEDASMELSRAIAKGWDKFSADMELGAIHLRRGDVAAAEKLLEQHRSAGTQQGEWHFLQGKIEEERGNRLTALGHYERAMELRPDHAPILFAAAWLYDLIGEENRAIALYQKLIGEPRAHVNALINLAVIYEDEGEYEAASECLRRVLKAFPNHARAREFLKDVESGQLLVVEEAPVDKPDPRQRLLDMTITEFELSVRARNCLKKMNIRTLGELMKHTESELLAYKNFGETSLNEIKNLLAKKALRLGQRLEDIDPGAVVAASPTPAPAPRAHVPPGRESILSKPVSDLELSVRSRRCLQRLNVVTIGDLLSHSEADLLATRNFGATSLNEIKGRLTEIGLSLPPKR